MNLVSPVDAFHMEEVDIQSLRRRARVLAEMAREEDLGTGDITSALLPDHGRTRYRLLAREPGVFAGRIVAEEIVQAYDADVTLDWGNVARDGLVINEAPMELAKLEGPRQCILQIERVLLNFLQRLSGIATATRAFNEAVKGTGARIFDTRKTTPGWRLLEKYAVRCGGGYNHRMGLHDAVLIKDNHLAGVATDRLAAHVFSMLNRLDAGGVQPKYVAVEADTLPQAIELFKVVGIQIVLLDNFSIDDLRAAVQRRNDEGLRGRVELEASGGITLQNVRAVAETGVERISVGAITHSVKSLDMAVER